MLSLLVTSLFPWYLICAAHPTGHAHHDHEGPSLCEQMKNHAGHQPAFWPPMECEHLSAPVDDYQTNSSPEIKPQKQWLASIFVFILKVELPDWDHVFVAITEKRGSLDPPLGEVCPRGPPFRFL